MENLQATGEKVLQSLLEVIQKWLDNAPEYVVDFMNRFVRYTVITDVLTLLWWLLAVYIGIYFLKKLYPKLDDDYSWNVFAWSAAIAAALVFIIIWLCKVVVELIEVCTIPEVTLINYLR